MFFFFGRVYKKKKIEKSFSQNFLCERKNCKTSKAEGKQFISWKTLGTTHRNKEAALKWNRILFRLIQTEVLQIMRFNKKNLSYNGRKFYTKFFIKVGAPQFEF